MKLFGEYLKEHARLIAASVLAAAIFLASFALYGLPLLAVAYPALLCLVLAAYSSYGTLHRQNAVTPSSWRSRR